MFATCYCMCRMMTEWYKNWLHERHTSVYVSPRYTNGCTRTEVKSCLFVMLRKSMHGYGASRVRPVSENEALRWHELN